MAYAYFIDEYCEIGADYKIERSVLFNAYKLSDMFEPMKANIFYMKVEGLGFNVKMIRGKRYITGLRIKEAVDGDGDDDDMV
jgi:hypothetical protein